MGLSSFSFLFLFLFFSPIERATRCCVNARLGRLVSPHCLSMQGELNSTVSRVFKASIQLYAEYGTVPRRPRFPAIHQSRRHSEGSMFINGGATSGFVNGAQVTPRLVNRVSKKRRPQGNIPKAKAS